MKKWLLILLLWSNLSLASTQVFDVPRYFNKSNWNSWLNLETRISNSNADTIILNWKGNGGYVFLGNKFISFLKNTNKFIVIRVTGPTFSMHSIVACAGNKLELNSGFLMFHLREDLDTSRVDLSRDSQRENTELMTMCINKGIVTNRDIQKVNQDNVLYVYPDGIKTLTTDTRIKGN